jgi:hypothetical protein
VGRWQPHGYMGLELRGFPPCPAHLALTSSCNRLLITGYVSARAASDDSTGVFSAFVSVAPVTDWRNYDSIYTERCVACLGTIILQFFHFPMSESIFDVAEGCRYMGELTQLTLPSYMNSSLVSPQRR